MVPEVASSLALSLVLLPLLAWRWRLSISTAVGGAIIIGGLAGLIAGWLGSSFPGLGTAVLILIELALIVSLTSLVLLARFYRDPERSPAETKNVILSPADGRVVYVNKVERGSSLVATKGERKFRLNEITDTDLLDNATYLVGIDMNILNVHVNRSPIAGKAIFQKHIKGRFMSLRKQESETLNDRVTTVIGNGTFKVAVIQIASRLVRRIVSHIREGDNLDIGQRIGAIVFGSQVDVAIPALADLRLEVESGDEVLAGVSVIARYGEGEVPRTEEEA